MQETHKERLVRGINWALELVLAQWYKQERYAIDADAKVFRLKEILKRQHDDPDDFGSFSGPNAQTSPRTR